MTQEQPENESKAQPSTTPTSAAPEKSAEDTRTQAEAQDDTKSQGSMKKSVTRDEPLNTKNEEKVQEGRVSRDNMKESGSSKSITGTTVAQSQHQPPPTFISPRDRLFGLSSEVHTFNTRLLEKTSDGILKAAKVGNIQALKELHEKGYSLLCIDTTGQTALHLASRYGHKDIVRYLIACAPSSILNMIDNDKGQTALHKAAQYKRRSVCCMLVAGGATLSIKDRQGNTPRDLALQAEDRELAAYLYSQEQFQLTTEEMENAL